MDKPTNLKQIRNRSDTTEIEIKQKAEFWQANDSKQIIFKFTKEIEEVNMLELGQQPKARIRDISFEKIDKSTETFLRGEPCF